MLSFLLPFAGKIIDAAIARIPDDAELGEKLIEICLHILTKAVAMDDFNEMESPFLAVAGVETNGDVRFYVEHINAPTNLGPGHTVGGIKFVF